MATESMSNFRSRVASISALQAGLRGGIKTGPTAVIALAAIQGCDFDESDIQRALSTNDLNYFELGLVSAGRTLFVSFSNEATRFAGKGDVRKATVQP